MTGTAHTRRRDDRGTAALEGAFITSAVLAPLLVFVLVIGGLLLQQQSVGLYPPRLSQTVASGSCTQQQIIDRVTKSAAQSIYALNANTLNGLGITSADALIPFLTTTVTSAGGLGVDVTVSLNIPGASRLGGLLPAGAATIVRDTTTRLSSVSLSTGSSAGTGCYP